MSAPPAEQSRRALPSVAPPLAGYVASLVAYVVLGYLFRSALLNWIVGPLFLVGSLHVLPRLTARRAARAQG